MNPKTQIHLSPTGKIRLVHCIGTMRIGGAEKQLAELITRLPRERFEQCLVLLQGGTALEEGAPLIERVKAAGCEVVSLDYQQKFSKLDPRCYLALYRALKKYKVFLKSFRPHILHAQLFWANIISVAAGRWAAVPAIITSRLQLSNYKFGKALLQRIENLANNFTTSIWVNSEAVRKDVLFYENVDAQKLHRIYNGVVLDDFQPNDAEPLRREFEIQPDELVIMAVANLHPYKGHWDLIRAFAALLKDHPHLRLIMPGRDQGMRARLEGLIQELGLEGKALLIGERKDIPTLLTIADIVVHPSHEEGFSNSILEAMTAGKPLVVTDVGGNPEAVKSGENGFVVPPRNEKLLAEALKILITKPNLRARMGTASRARIEQEFSMKIHIRNFVKYYESLLVEPK